ncbi:MAG TPA: ABC transporter permease, partial [Candidatus Berkiella sp.]|nr:ABC transporter permease [Candidatus Berkiella sp.]
EKKQVEQNLNVHNIGNWCWQHQNELTLVPYVVSTFKPDKVVVGTLSGIEKHLQWSIAEGRALHRLDEKSKVVVIGQGVAATLGSVLSLEGQYVEVVGILAPIEQNPLLEFDPNKSIFIGLEMLARLKAIPWVDSFIIQTDHTTLSDAQHTFKTKVRTWFGIKSMFIRDATFFAQVLHKQVNMTVKMLKMIALTTLLLGMLSIINLLVILIDERKKEIGLRLALGATPLVVFWQFLREITFLCSFGAVGGIVFGHLAAYIIVMQLGLTYYFGWFSWAVGLPVSMLMGIFVGIIPTLFAAQLHPVKLLNS